MGPVTDAMDTIWIGLPFKAVVLAELDPPAWFPLLEQAAASPAIATIPTAMMERPFNVSPPQIRRISDVPAQECAGLKLANTCRDSK